MAASPDVDRYDLVIAGAGISGLTVAHDLRAWTVRLVVLEAGSRPGGVIRTDRQDGFVIDAGPDSLLVQKPAGIELCRELGLGPRLVPTVRRTAYVLRTGRLFPLPARSALGIPLRLTELARARLFSPLGRVRLACDLFLPAGGPEGDESVASFVERRFGTEAVDYLADPLLAGIHAGDVHRLSVRALFPALVDAERRHGSVIRALRRSSHHRPLSSEGLFRSLRGGLGELPETLAAGLPAGRIRYETTLLGVAGSGPYTLRLSTGDHLETTRLVLAVPASVCAGLLRSVDPELAALCGAVRFTSTALVVLAYPRAAIAHPLDGTGFVVPQVERSSRLMACTWVSSKWPDRAPPGQALLRAFIGGARDPELLDSSDADLVSLAHGELGRLLTIRQPPLFSRVYRWPAATPQHEVGHLARVAAIDARLGRLPGLHLTGSSFRGVGIPDCIADARAAARSILRDSGL